MEKATLNLHDLGCKARNKNEMYRILTCNAKMHLPPIKETSMYHVRDIFYNKKKALFNDEVKVRTVPHINGLRVKDLIWFLENKCRDGVDYLPENYCEKALNRQWLINLCNTFNEPEFDVMIASAIKDREQHFLQKNTMQIEADPRIVDALNQSSFISTSRGRSHLLIRKSNKMSQDQKLKEEIKDYEHQVSCYRRDILDLKDEVEKLTSELSQKENLEVQNDNNAELLNSLFKRGIIDENGEVLKEAEGDE